LQQVPQPPQVRQRPEAGQQVIFNWLQLQQPESALVTAGSTPASS
jgi:hypothetical protein